MTMARSVLVTGGNGFIGRHLVRRLLADGCEVTLLQRSPDVIDARIELLRVQGLSSNLMSDVLAGRRFDWLVHLAAYGVRPQDRNIEEMFRINVDVTRYLVERASSWCPRAIVIGGSGSEYMLDGVDGPVAEDHPLEAFKPYGASKAAGTLCATAIGCAWAMPLAVCRMFGVYGPGEAPHRLVSSLVNGLRGTDRVPLSPGLQKRDFLFVEDAVEALVKVGCALEAQPKQLILNVGTGEPISVREFAGRVAMILGVPVERLGFGDIPMRLDEAMVFSGIPLKLSAYTGWQPKVGLDEGIGRCVDERGTCSSPIGRRSH